MIDKTDISPGTSVYLSDLSGSAINYSDYDPRRALVLLKLNLLFFDVVVIGGLPLCGSPLMIELFRTDTNAMKYLYKEGILRPVLRHSDERSANYDIRTVAERVVSSGTRTVMPPKFYSDHAKTIHESNPHYVRIEEIPYKRRLTKSILDVLISQRKTLSYRDDSSRIKEINQSIDICLDLYPDKGTINSITDLYNIAEKSLSEKMASEVKAVAEFAAHRAYGILTRTHVSSPPQAAEFIRVLGECNRQEHQSTTKRTEISTSITKISTNINADLISKLRMHEIVKLRRTSEFKAIRRQLSRLRSGYDINVHSLSEECNHCANIVNKFSEETPGDNSLYIRMVEESKKREIRIALTRIGDATVALELLLAKIGVASPDFILPLNTLILSSKYIIREKRIWLELSTAPKDEYLPETGCLTDVKAIGH